MTDASCAVIAGIRAGTVSPVIGTEVLRPVGAVLLMGGPDRPPIGVPISIVILYIVVWRLQNRARLRCTAVGICLEAVSGGARSERALEAVVSM